MQTCKTCRWWDQYHNQNMEPIDKGKCVGIEITGISGTIQKNKLRPGIATGPGWKYLGDYGSTHGDFGCIHHTPKENGDER